MSTLNQVPQALTHQQIRVLALFYMCMNVTWVVKTFTKPCFLKDRPNQPKENDQENHQTAATKLRLLMLVNQSRNCQCHKFKFAIYMSCQKYNYQTNFNLLSLKSKENRITDIFLMLLFSFHIRRVIRIVVALETL